MVVIVGAMIVLVSVLVGFSMAGGKVMSLIHLSEFVTIGGASFGALILMSPVKVIKDLVKGVIQTIKGSAFGKAACVDLLKLQYALARLVRQEGLLALDTHVTNPESSALLREHPKLNGNHHARAFLCDSLAMILDGTVESAQLGEWLEEEISVVEREHHAASDALAKSADALPGFGIVAAVLGIVVTMQSIGGPVDEIGYKVGAALVGTFLGILAAYGFVAPLAARMQSLGDQEILFFRAMAVGVIAMNDGASPKDVVTRARRVMSTDCRPNQAELKDMFG